jgi:hypothetical protein
VPRTDMTAAMRIRISDPSYLGDLERSLCAAECAIGQVGPHELEVFVPGAPRDEQARREILIYLDTWKAMNLGVDVTLD